MEYVYPAVFHPNDDGTYTVTYPDLPGCISEGKSLANAMYMAQSALTQWVAYHVDKKIDLSPASHAKSIETKNDEFVNLIRADVKDGRSVKRTIRIPKWMDDLVIKSGLSLSRVLQDALEQRFR